MIVLRLTMARYACSVGLVAVVAATIGFDIGGAAFAQHYPSHTVKIVVPFPAGGPSDFVARLLGDKLSARLGQPFIIENRPGVSGNLGTDAVAKAAPDGHTLLLVLDTPLTVSPALYKKLAFDPERDFAPISAIVSFPMMLAAHPSVPANSAAEFVAWAKGRKDRPLTYGSGGGIGNPGHLTMEYFRAQAGFDATHVPYKGNARIVTDLVSGQIQAGFVATPGVAPHVKEGKLKGFAVSSSQRSSLAPHVPTIGDAGYPGLEVEFFMAMLAPSGVPEPIRARLEREIRQVLNAPDIQARLRALDLQPIGNTGAQAKAQLAAATKRWAGVIKAAKIQTN